MSKFVKKGFWVPYENSTEYPTLQQAMKAITKYCEENHHTCTFLSDDRVLIDETVYGIYRGQEMGGWGNYGIKCTEIKKE